MTIQSIWNEETTVKAYETDFAGKWKPASFFQAMQVAASHHAAHLGYDFDRMMAQEMIWILSRVRVHFKAFPGIDEKVALETWPKGLQQKVFFMRDFYLRGEDGRLLAEASTAWVLVNPKARRMLLPHSLPWQIPDNDGRSAIDAPVEKISLPDGLPQKICVAATYSTVDVMGHVNNARYAEWVCDAFPVEMFERRNVEWIQINYSNEVRPGEQVSICAGEQDGAAGAWLVEGRNLTSGARAFEAAIKFR